MLLFVCLTEFKLTAGDCLFNEETQKAMASAAKRILNSLTELEKGTGARIEHKIVYGLHWDHLKLRIVAHFMNRPGIWIMELLPGGHCPASHFLEPRLECAIWSYDRWYIHWSVAYYLCSVCRQAGNRTPEEHGTRSARLLIRFAVPDVKVSTPKLTIEITRALISVLLSSEPQLPNEDAPTPQNLSDSYLTGLRQYWRDCESFRIPEEWMVSILLFVLV